MITPQSIAAPGERRMKSLSLLIGKEVKDVYGYISDIGGGATFKLARIVFEDGTQLAVEGEHDFPYLTDWDKQPNFNEETLERLRQEVGNEYGA